jgi:hypothetical protein
MKCVSTCVNHSLVARSVKAATARGLRFFCEGDPTIIVPNWFYLIVLLWTEESCTTLDGSNPIKNGINHLSTGGGFLPSTVNHFCICLHQLPDSKLGNFKMVRLNSVYMDGIVFSWPKTRRELGGTGWSLQVIPTAGQRISRGTKGETAHGLWIRNQHSTVESMYI